MSDTATIEGLPAGAELRPIKKQTPQTIQGLPAGAELRPIKQESSAPISGLPAGAMLKPITATPQETSSHKAWTAARQNEPAKVASKPSKTSILDMPSEPEEGTLSKEPLGSPLMVGTQVLSGGKYVSFGEFMRDNAKQMKEGHGVLNAVVDTGIIAGDLAEGLTNPQTLAILGVMAVAPEAGFPLLLKKGADAYFSVDQARAAAKEINEGYQAHLAGDDREAYRKFGSAAVQTVFAVLSGKGVARKPTPVGAIEPKAKAETKAKPNIEEKPTEPVETAEQKALRVLTEGVDGTSKPEAKPEGKSEPMKPAYTGSERRVADKVKDRERIDAMQFGINEMRRNLESPDTPEADKESLRTAIKQHSEMLDELRAKARGTKQTAGTAEGVKADNDFFQQAKQELGEGASTSQVAMRAQELKEQAAKPPKAEPVHAETDVRVASVDPDTLELDPRRFQYKLRGDDTGSQGHLSGSLWNDNYAGVVDVWRDPADGKTYVVNGHNRVSLAREPQNQGKVGKIDVKYINAATAAEARAKGALINIADNQGTAIDAAKFFRDSGMTVERLRAEGLQITRAIAENGMALSRLSEPIFNDVINERIPMNRAVEIGRITDVPEQQEAILTLIKRAESKGKHITNDVIKELGRRATIAQSVEDTGDNDPSQPRLFKIEAMEKNLALEEAELSDFFRSRIKDDTKLFGVLARGTRADRVKDAKVGSVNKTKAGAKKTEAEQALEVYDKESVRLGEVNDIIQQATKEIFEGGNESAIREKAYESVREALSQAVKGTTGKNAKRGSTAPQGKRSGPGEQKASGESLEPVKPVESEGKIIPPIDSQNIDIISPEEAKRRFRAGEDVFAPIMAGSEKEGIFQLESEAEIDEFADELYGRRDHSKTLEEGEPSAEKRDEDGNLILGTEGAMDMFGGGEPEPEAGAGDKSTQPVKNEPAKPKKSKKITPMDIIREAYKPGSVVEGYGKSLDKVLEFRESPDIIGGWEVKVIGSDKDGNPLPGEGPRTHHTRPEKKDFVAATKRLEEKQRVEQAVSKAKDGEKKVDLSADFTSEGLRARFNIPEDVQIRHLASDGTITRTQDGHWKIAGEKGLERLRNGDFFGEDPAEPEVKAKEGEKLASDDLGIHFARTENGNIKLGADPAALGKILGSSLYKDKAPKVITKELVQNAMDAVRGSKKKTVAVDLDYTNSVITIADSGLGMTREELETVFTDLGSSGKRDQEAASGGFGLAKAAPLMMSKKLEVVSVVEVGGKKIENSFTSTPEQMLGEGVAVQSREVPSDTPTGTRIKAHVEGDLYSAREYIASSRLSLNAPGELEFTENGRISPLADKGKVPKTPAITTNIPGATAKVYTSTTKELANHWGQMPVEVHNNGIYQFTNHVTIPENMRGMPGRIAVDIHATVAEGHPDYPFLANREQLRSEASSAIKKLVKEKILDPLIQGQRDTISELYHSLPKMKSEGYDIPILDSGSRMTTKELEAIQSHPVVKELAELIHETSFAAIERARKTPGMEAFAKNIKRIGLVFSSDVHGVFIEDPKDASHATVFINPFQGIGEDPASAASLIWHTIKHELVHDLVKGHNERFTSAEVQVSRAMGRLEIESLWNLTDAYGGKEGEGFDGNTGIRKELVRPIQLYERSRQRGEASPDLFRSEASRRGGKYGARDEGRDAEGLRDGREATLWDDEPTLPGLEKPVAEQRQAAQEHRDGEVSAEMQQKLSSPLGSVNKAAGEMESRSLLFRGTDASPQKEMFAAESEAAEAAKVEQRKAQEASEKSFNQAQELGETLFSGFGDPNLFRRLFPNVAKTFREWAEDGPTQESEQRATMRETRGKLDRAEAVAADALEKIKNSWTRRSHDEVREFWKAYESGGIDSLPEADRPFAGMLKAIAEHDAEVVQGLRPELLQDLIENYIGHIWESRAKDKVELGLIQKAIHKMTHRGGDFPEAQAKRPFGGSAAFLKKRKFPTMEDGIKAGLTPRSWNPVVMALLKHHEVQKFVMAHKTLDLMKENGNAQFYKSGSKDIPNGWTKLDDRMGEVKRPVKEIAADGKEYTRYEPTGNYWAPADVARVFNNFVSKGISGRSSVYDTIRNFNDKLNAFQLGISAYHASATGLNSAASEMGLGIQQLYEGTGPGLSSTQRVGKFVEGTKHVAAGVVIPVAVARNIVNGHKLLREWMSPGSYKKFAKEAQMTQVSGGRYTMNSIEIKPWDDLMNRYHDLYHDFQEREFKSLAKKTPEFAWKHIGAAIDITTRPVMGWLVPRMKAGAFYDMTHNILENAAREGWSHEKTRARVQKAWDSVDNRYGQVVYDNYFWNNAVKDVAQVATRSVGWNVGSFKEGGGAIKDTAVQALGALGGARPEITDRMAFTYSAALVYGLAGAVAGYLWTGKRPKELYDYYFPPDTEGIRHSMPGYGKDPFAFTHDPTGTVLNKMAPVWEMTSQLLHNRDFYGTEIRHKDDSNVQQAEQVTKWLAGNFVPFAFSSAIRTMKEKGADTSSIRAVLRAAVEHPKDVVVGLLGINPAPRWIQNSNAVNRANEYRLSNRPPGTRSAEDTRRNERENAVTQLYRAANRKGEKPNPEELKKYREHLTREQIAIARNDATMNPIVKAARGLNIEQMTYVYGDATPEERKAMHGLIASHAWKWKQIDDAGRKQKVHDLLVKYGILHQ